MQGAAGSPNIIAGKTEPGDFPFLDTEALFSRAQRGPEGITATCRAPSQAVSLGLQYSRDRWAHLLGGSNPEYTPYSFIHSWRVCSVPS